MVQGTIEKQSFRAILKIYIPFTKIYIVKKKTKIEIKIIKLISEKNSVRCLQCSLEIINRLLNYQCASTFSCIFLEIERLSILPLRKKSTAEPSSFGMEVFLPDSSKGGKEEKGNAF